MGGKSYCFTPGGFLYRKDPGTEEAGGILLQLPHRRGRALQDRRAVRISSTLSLPIREAGLI